MTFPDQLVTADKSKGSVPSIYSVGEIESGNNTNVTDRVPLFNHHMVRSFTVDNFATDGSGHTDSHIANINEFLDFTLTFRSNLTHLK